MLCLCASLGGVWLSLLAEWVCGDVVGRFRFTGRVVVDCWCVLGKDNLRNFKTMRL